MKAAYSTPRCYRYQSPRQYSSETEVFAVKVHKGCDTAADYMNRRLDSGQRCKKQRKGQHSQSKSTRDLKAERTPSQNRVLVCHEPEGRGVAEMVAGKEGVRSHSQIERGVARLLAASWNRMIYDNRRGLGRKVKWGA